MVKIDSLQKGGLYEYTSRKETLSEIKRAEEARSNFCGWKKVCTKLSPRDHTNRMHGFVWYHRRTAVSNDG